MKNNKEKVLGFDVCASNRKEIVENIFKDFKTKKRNFIVNINPEIVVNNFKNKNILSKFNKEKYQIPDGIGIVYASKLKKGNIKERITGIDLMLELCEKSISNNGKIYLYGAKPNVAEKAKKELEQKFKNINIVGTSDGYGSTYEVIDKINNTDANILFVGLGSPKQEEFILNNKNKLKKILIFMPVGGSFDVISNNLKRAPQKMIDLNLEWLYRLIQEPKRFFRQFKLLFFLVLIIFKDKKGDSLWK